MSGQMENMAHEFGVLKEHQSKTDEAMQSVQNTLIALKLDSRVAALEAAAKGAPTSAAASPTTPTAPMSEPEVKKAKGIPPTPPAQRPRSPPPRPGTPAPSGRPAAGAATRASSVGASSVPNKKAVVGGSPRELPKAAFKQYWSNDLVPALGAEFGELGVVVSSNLGSRVLLVSFSDGAQLSSWAAVLDRPL